MTRVSSTLSLIERRIKQLVEEKVKRLKESGISLTLKPLTLRHLRSLPQTAYVVHLTPDSIVYVEDVEHLNNTYFNRSSNQVKIHILATNMFHINDLSCYTNLLTYSDLAGINYNWFSKHVCYSDAALVSVFVDSKKAVIRKEYISLHNVSKQQKVYKLQSTYVSRLHRALVWMNEKLSERDLFVTSWGKPLTELELAEILKFIQEKE